MKTTDGKRNAGLAILLSWSLYITFVFLTDWKDYGLIAGSEGRLTWTITRLSTFSVWLLLAALLLRYRKQAINWQSFVYACIATGVGAIGISSPFVTRSANDSIIAGTIVFYALVSGFLCITVSRPMVAAGLSVLLFVFQLSVDAVAHLFSGVFSFH